MLITDTRLLPESIASLLFSPPLTPPAMMRHAMFSDATPALFHTRHFHATSLLHYAFAIRLSGDATSCHEHDTLILALLLAMVKAYGVDYRHEELRYAAPAAATLRYADDYAIIVARHYQICHITTIRQQAYDMPILLPPLHGLLQAPAPLKMI